MHCESGAGIAQTLALPRGFAEVIKRIVKGLWNR